MIPARRQTKRHATQEILPANGTTTTAVVPVTCDQIPNMSLLIQSQNQTSVVEVDAGGSTGNGQSSGEMPDPALAQKNTKSMSIEDKHETQTAVVSNQHPKARHPQQTHYTSAEKLTLPPRTAKPKNKLANLLVSAMTFIDDAKGIVADGVPMNALDAAEAMSASTLSFRYTTTGKFDSSRSWLPISNILPQKAVPIMAMVPHTMSMSWVFTTIIFMTLLAAVPSVGTVAAIIQVILPSLDIWLATIIHFGPKHVKLLLLLNAYPIVPRVLAFILLPIFARQSWLHLATIVSFITLISSYLFIAVVRRFRPQRISTAVLSELPGSITTLVFAPIILLVCDSDTVSRALIVFISLLCSTLFATLQFSLYRTTHILGIGPSQDRSQHSDDEKYLAYQRNLSTCLASNMTCDEFTDRACKAIDFEGLREVSSSIDRERQRSLIEMSEQNKTLFFEHFERVFEGAKAKFVGEKRKIPSWMKMEEVQVSTSMFVCPKDDTSKMPYICPVAFYSDIIGVIRRDYESGYRMLCGLYKVCGADMSVALKSGGFFAMYTRHQKSISAVIQGRRVSPQCMHQDLFDAAIVPPMPSFITSFVGTTLKKVSSVGSEHNLEKGAAVALAIVRMISLYITADFGPEDLVQVL